MKDPAKMCIAPIKESRVHHKAVWTVLERIQS